MKQRPDKLIPATTKFVPPDGAMVQQTQDSISDTWLLSDSELAQIVELNEKLVSGLPFSESTLSVKQARELAKDKIYKLLRDKDDPWADVKAHAAAHDHILRDAKYRVMIDWMNDWIDRIESNKNFGRFSQMRLLGKGAFGAVFKAYDGHRDLAIKVAYVRDIPSDRYTIQSPLAPQLALFEEARHHARINVNRCVQLYDANSGLPERFDIESVLIHLRSQPLWFSMQWIDGESLRQIMDRGYKPGQTMTYERIIYLMTTIAETLRRLHACSPPGKEAVASSGHYIHKDLKPANLLIDREGDPWITDFGLATPRGKQQVSGNLVSGTPCYMAPEQYRADYVNAQSDIWAWGVIFYELLTGHTPFIATSVRELREKILLSDADAPSCTSPLQIPSAIDRLILKCLRRDRTGENSRYRSFQEVLQDLNLATLPTENKFAAATAGDNRYGWLAISVAIALLLVFASAATRWTKLAGVNQHSLKLTSADSMASARGGTDAAAHRNEKFSELAELAALWKRIPEAEVDSVVEMAKSGDSSQKKIAAAALFRHRQGLAMDYVMARSASENVTMRLPPVFVLGSQTRAIPLIRQHIASAKSEAYDLSDRLPPDFVAAYVAYLDNSEQMLSVLLQFLERYSPIEDNVTRMAWQLVGDTLNGTSTVERELDHLNTSIESCVDAFDTFRNTSVRLGGRTDWLPYPMVRHVLPGSPADFHKLMPGDILLQIGDTRMVRCDPAEVNDSISGPRQLKFLTIEGVKTIMMEQGQSSGCQYDTECCRVPVGVTFYPKAFLGWGGYQPPIFTNWLSDQPIKNITVTVSSTDGQSVTITKIDEIQPLGSALTEPSFSPDPQAKMTVTAPGFLPRTIELAEYLE